MTNDEPLCALCGKAVDFDKPSTASTVGVEPRRFYHGQCEQDYLESVWAKGGSPDCTLPAGLQARAGIMSETPPTIETLTQCRDHWKAAFQHERKNVIRLRAMLFGWHNWIGTKCDCADCQLVRQHGKYAPPKPTDSGFDIATEEELHRTFSE